MNQTQKIGLFLAVIALGLSVVFHAPWDGYVYFEHVFNARSEQPIFFWFGDIVHVYVAVTAIATAALLWVYLFQSARPETPPL